MGDDLKVFVVKVLPDVSTLSSLVTISIANWSHDERIMQLQGRKPLTVSHHPIKFGVGKHCDSGDIIDLVCHVILQDHVVTGYMTLWIKVCHGKSTPSQVWWQ